MNEQPLLDAASDAAGELSAAIAGPMLPKDTFQGYELIRELQRGGQGIVYRARQISTGRDVAIKVVREEPFLGRTNKVRFEQEVQILGKLHHPNIVTIHDSGLTGQSCFLVMDYVPGLPVDSYVAVQEAPLRQTLLLFGKICDAVQAAHLEGVIHRDLKPSNILVDNSGEPHILDFGLAKLTNENKHGRAHHEHTVTGQFVGTLSWASPEQVAGQNIDLRTDIYSLGVVLYHAVTGEFPYRVDGSMPSVAARIIDATPRRPGSIRKGIDADLDAIILMCLEKEPGRRYQSAASIAGDIRRLLNHEPIIARPPSTAYQLRKLIRRHRFSTALLCLILVILIASAGVMSVLYGQAIRQRDYAQAAELSAERRRIDAERQADVTAAISEFLIEDLLTAPLPEIAQGEPLTVRDVLENASKKINSSVSDPRVKVPILATLGRAFLGLGRFVDAERHLRAASEIANREFGEHDPDTLRIQLQLTDVLLNMGKYVAADALAEKTYEGMKATFGTENVETFRAASLRAHAYWWSGDLEAARHLHRNVLESRRSVLGVTHPDTLQAFTQWAISEFLGPTGGEEFEPIFRETLENCRDVFGPAHPNTLRASVTLAASLCQQRQFPEAEHLFETALPVLRAVAGPNHPDTLSALVHFSILRQRQDRLDEAEELCQEASVRAVETLGIDSPISCWIRDRLGHILYAQGEFSCALGIYRDVLQRRRARYGTNDATVESSLASVGAILAELGKFAEAAEILEEARHIHIESNNGIATSPASLRPLVKALMGLGRTEDARHYALQHLVLTGNAADVAVGHAYSLNAHARTLLDVEPVDLRDPRLALEYALRAFDASTDEYHYNRYTLALAYKANGMLPEAIDLLKRALGAISIEYSFERSLYEDALALVYQEAGDASAAEQVYRNTLALRRDVFPKDHPDVAMALESLATNLVRHGNWTEAETLLRECIRIRKSALGLQHWRTASAQSLLGEALFHMGSTAEACELIQASSDALLSIDDIPTSASEVATHRVLLCSSFLYENPS